MDWIKNRYDQFVLALMALVLLGFSALLAMRSNSFPENFSAAQATVVPSEKIPELDLAPVKNAEAQAEQPAVWQLKPGANPFTFVPDLYVIDLATSQPKKVTEGSRHDDSLTGKKIPNVFFTSHNLSPLDPAIAKQDTDGDGFSNEDEFRGSRDPLDPNSWHDSTDPQDENSHPPYVTKLFLKKWIRVPFRLRFQAYTGKVSAPKEIDFQMNAIDRGRKTEFLHLEDKVANSPYRLESFEFKERENKSTGEKDDVSELTVINTETGDSVVLVRGQVTDSPDSYALFEYQCFPAGVHKWTSKDIQVKKLGEFILLPEKDKRYKLIDIKEGQAVIQLPDAGGNYIVIPDPRSKP
jgi:hypothetical protein